VSNSITNAGEGQRKEAIAVEPRVKTSSRAAAKIGGWGIRKGGEKSTRRIRERGLKTVRTVRSLTDSERKGGSGERDRHRGKSAPSEQISN